MSKLPNVTDAYKLVRSHVDKYTEWEIKQIFYAAKVKL